MSIAGEVIPSEGSPARGLHESLHSLAFTTSSKISTLSLTQASFGCSEEITNPSCVGSHGRFLVAVDGRVFSDQELRGKLDAPPSAPNSELFALAYQRWGASFPDHIDGEFAAALWDSVEKRLLLVRDATGRGIIHYRLHGGALYFASEPRGLRHWPGLPVADICDVAVARMMTSQAERDGTFFRGIRRLPGGSILNWRPGSQQVSTATYWFPTQLPQLSVKDPREYGEAVRAAMVRGLQKRLPESALVAAQMSSGLDSSAVTALAAQMLAQQGRRIIAYTSSPVHQVNAADRHTGRFGDEWPLASKVAAMYPNIEHIRIATNQSGLWESLDELSDAWGFTYSFLRNARWYHGLFRHAKERGATIMLEGWAGNLTGSYAGSFGLYDLRRRGHWTELVRAMRRRHRNGASWRSLVYSAWMPTPRTVGVLSTIRGRKASTLFDRTLLRPEFYKETNLPLKRLSSVGQILEGDRTNGRSWRLSVLQQTESGMPGVAIQRVFGIRRVDPTSDRELAELCLSIPDEAFAPDGVPRDLYRRAMRNDLPEELLAERRRGLQGSDSVELIREALPLLWDEWERLSVSPIAQRVLDLQRMRRMLEELPGTTKPFAQLDVEYDYTLGGAITLGRFLRRVESGEANV